jgi:CRISPR-associated protein Cas1
MVSKAIGPNSMLDNAPTAADGLPLVPARMLNELVYCPRLFHLEWVQAEWAPNSDTTAGERQHRRQDIPRGRLPATQGELSPQPPQAISATAVDMSAASIGLIAKIDLLEGVGKEVIPIEFKRGHGPEPSGVWAPDRIQVGAQLLILRANGYEVDHGLVSYRDARRRERVDLTADLAEEVLALRDEALRIAQSAKAPPPLVNSPKCPRCSLVSICLPDEVNRLRGLRATAGSLTPSDDPGAFTGDGEAGVVVDGAHNGDAGNGSHATLEAGIEDTQAGHPAPSHAPIPANGEDRTQAAGNVSHSLTAAPQGLDGPETRTAADPSSAQNSDPHAENDPDAGQVRRLVAPNIEAQPLVVQTSGTRIGRSGELLTIQPLDGPKSEVPLLDISDLALFGNVQISTQALGACFYAGIPVAYFSAGGWFQGLATAPGGRNAQVRLDQYQLVSDPARSLETARQLIHRKLRNCRTLLRRNQRSEEGATLKELERLSTAVLSAQSPETLLGLEGLGAKAYFAAVPEMFTKRGLEFDFQHRNRRPPTDPVNALLSLAYSMLTKHWTGALQAIGLDPYVGCFHSVKHGKPALALDLMEEFRPLIADSVVL